MEPTPVVACFLRNRDDVLLLRHSEAVGSYSGAWGAVSGHVAPDDEDGDDTRSPDDAARAGIEEETGLLAACELVRSREPFEVQSDEHGGWLVHPFLFDCESRTVEDDEETAETAWVPPTEILRRETVPELWRSYASVRPTVETIRADDDHGSSYLSLRALDVLRDRAAELAAGVDRADDRWTELADLARELLAARSGMAALANRVNRAMAEADERTPAAVEQCAQAAVEGARTADDGAAERAASLLDGEAVLTLSRSGTVLAALRRADPASVMVATSYPGGEGVDVAEALAADDVDATLVPDAAVAHHLATGEVDAVVVGVDTVLADGGVVNKVGTRGAALAAAREGVPLYAVTASDKVAPDADPHLGSVDFRTVSDGEPPPSVAAPLFDVTPADLVAGIVTEEGVLDGDDVARAADDHRALAEW
jgi:translation initiation factor 2B subunit (eIF-2B alpha/beta/delta family)/8-oxo-dGTP pyrophosphatase MutT (NUDIX family)